MANKKHLKILKQGVDVWNEWREENPDIIPNLSGEFLDNIKLIKINFDNANLHAAYLMKTDLSYASLRGADLSQAELENATLKGAILNSAYLSLANLTNTNLQNAEIMNSVLVQTNLKKADITNCKVYGISAWDVQFDETKQNNLIITPPGVPTITVDNLEVAQFIYLLINNKKIRSVIDAIGKKAVLILGRFTPERKKILDAIKDKLRSKDYLPILFDFERPNNRDITETISILAHLSRFIIADITNAKAIPQELQAIVPNLPSIAVQPLLQEGKDEYGMFEHFKRYPWVLTIHRYRGLYDLLETLEEKVIAPAEAKILEITIG